MILSGSKIFQMSAADYALHSGFDSRAKVNSGAKLTQRPQTTKIQSAK